MKGREIAAASARDQDLLAHAIGAFQDNDVPTAFAGLDRAHQSRGSGAQNYSIEFVDHVSDICTGKPAAKRLLHSLCGIGLRSILYGQSRIPSICYIADRFC